MALQPVTSRFDPALLKAAKYEARRKGLSLNQFVQTAVAARVAWCASEREPFSEAMREVYDAADRAVVLYGQE